MSVFGAMDVYFWDYGLLGKLGFSPVRHFSKSWGFVIIGHMQ